MKSAKKQLKINRRGWFVTETAEMEATPRDETICESIIDAKAVHKYSKIAGKPIFNISLNCPDSSVRLCGIIFEFDTIFFSLFSAVFCSS
ncbi:MAG: hypothetical protein RSC58_03460 [Ruthenibacterium sp.]